MQAVVGQTLGEVGGGEGVGEKVFHALEAIRCRSGEAIQKGVFVVEQGEVGGEVGLKSLSGKRAGYGVLSVTR